MNPGIIALNLMDSNLFPNIMATGMISRNIMDTGMIALNRKQQE